MDSAWLLFRSRASFAVLHAALAVRTAMQLAVTGIVYLAIVTRAVGVKRVAIHLRTTLRNTMQQPVSGHPDNAPHGTDEQVAEALPTDWSNRIRVANPEIRKVFRLTDPRIRRLQGTCISRILLRECGISAPDIDLSLLSGWSSVVWIRHNLFNAAGLRHGQTLPYDEFLERCRVVFPAIARTLGMAPPEAPSSGTGDVREYTDSAIRQSLYPTEIIRYRRALKCRQIASTYRVFSRRTIRHLAIIRFAFHGKALSLILNVPGLRPESVRRALHALETHYPIPGALHGNMES